MPKQNFTINDFSGGSNGYIAPQDIGDNEIAQCQGFKAEPGVVNVLGDMLAAYTISAASAAMDIEAGYGLYGFSHDYNNSAVLTSTDYLVMLSRISSDSHNKIDIHHGSWGTDVIDLGGSSSNVRMASIKPTFFIASGELRVSPGNFASVDSGEDMGGVLALDKVYGGVVAATLATGGTNYIAAGDLIIVEDMEFIVLSIDGDSCFFGRNMTGTFKNATIATDAQVNVMPDTRWRGIIKRDLFENSLGSIAQWYSTYAHPRAPAVYNSNIQLGLGEGFPFMVKVYDESTAAVIDGSISPTLVIGYKENTDNADAIWDGAEIDLYVTALYDDIKQESQPCQCKVGIEIPAGEELAIWVGVNYAGVVAATSTNTYLINKRVTGARIYYEDTTSDPGILYQLIEIDFKHGAKKADELSYTDWRVETANKSVGCPFNEASGSAAAARITGDAFIFATPPKIFTYEINTGYPMEVNTHARYKTSTVVNSRLFVGNVYQSGRAHGERMISSPTYKYDILPEYGDHVMDVTVDDGDEIIKLESYADRVLQFKKRALYIINVGSGFGEELVESEHRNMGVENPSQTCMTEFGVAWVNTSGVFIYDGQEITNLVQNKLKITDSTRPRALNVTESNIPLIGYIPEHKWLVVHPQSKAADANDVEAWIHDFKNESWTYSKQFTTTAKLKTNMIWSNDNKLIYGAEALGAQPDFFKYQAPANDTAIGNLLFLTKDFNLNIPGVKKKLTSIYVTYSAEANTRIEVDVLYTHPTGSTDNAMEEADGGETYYVEATGFKDTSANLRTVELVPSTNVVNAYTFQLKLHNPNAAYPSGADFKLYDIQFVFRELSTR